MALWQKGPQVAGTQVEWPAGTPWLVLKTLKNAAVPPVKGAYYSPVAVADPRDATIAALQVQLAACQGAPPAVFNPQSHTVDVRLPQATDFEFALIPTSN